MKERQYVNVFCRCVYYIDRDIKKYISDRMDAIMGTVINQLPSYNRME